MWYLFQNCLLKSIVNYFGMTLGTLYLSLISVVHADEDTSSSQESLYLIYYFSSSRIYYLMAALICGNILQRVNPNLGRYKALCALADNSLWGIPSLITWSGYNWGSISSHVIQLVIGSNSSNSSIHLIAVINQVWHPLRYKERHDWFNNKSV